MTNYYSDKLQTILEAIDELQEDAPTTNVGDGSIAGAAPGEEPPVSKKKQKEYVEKNKKLEENIIQEGVWGHSFGKEWINAKKALSNLWKDYRKELDKNYPKYKASAKLREMYTWMEELYDEIWEKEGRPGRR